MRVSIIRMIEELESSGGRVSDACGFIKAASTVATIFTVEASHRRNVRFQSNVRGKVSPGYKADTRHDTPEKSFLIRTFPRSDIFAK